MTARLSQEALRDAAIVAGETGAVIVIQFGNKTYRIAPDASNMPLSTSEKDGAECDEAFGISK